MGKLKNMRNLSKNKTGARLHLCNLAPIYIIRCSVSLVVKLSWKFTIQDSAVLVSLQQ